MRSQKVTVATEVAGPTARLVAVLSVAVAGLAVAGMQSAVHWRGDHNGFLLLVGFNTFLAALATWFFHTRWRLLGDLFDRQVKNVFLPITCHFLFVLTLEALAPPPEVRSLFIQISWVMSQALAATILLYTFKGGEDHGPVRRRLRTIMALATAVVIWAIFERLSPEGQELGIAPMEVGLATLFLLAATVPLLGAGAQRHKREIWLGAAFLLTAVAHVNLSFSHGVYDSPFMWGFVLLAISLAMPTIGAVQENVTLLESQTALSDRLKRLRRRMEILLDTLPVLVLSVDRERNLRYANSAASSLFAVPHGVSDGSDGPGWLERIHPNHRPQVFAAIPSVLEEGRKSWEEIVRVEDVDGGVHWLNTQMHPVVDPVVNETLIQVVATDVTDLQLARRAAEARQSRLVFLSNLAQTVAGEVEEQRILDHFLEMGSEILPMRSLLLYRPLPDSSGLQLVAGAGAGVEAFEEERFRPIRAGEHPCWQAFQGGFLLTTTTSAALADELAGWLAAEHEISHLSYLPLLAAGRSVGIILTTSSSALDLSAEDIDLLTQVGFLLGGAVYLAQLVRELDEQRAVAFEASRLKSEFLANTSHELRTPLTAILGFLRLLMDGAVKDPAKQREFMEIAHESAEKLLNIINDVLDLAKIEAGRLEVHRAPVPARTVLEDVRTLFKHQMKSKGLEFIIDTPKSKLVIWADPDRTLQVLTNLMSNAMKFTMRGGSITVSCTAEDGDIAFSVQDTGIGIAPKELEKIFSSFYQVDGSSTREHGGTGLGLTISRRLAEIMGGTLELESPGVERGTTARLRLQEFTAEHEAASRD
jgi:PAS domain S-box-containing protein